jgi:hypothetical protein
MPRQSVEAKSGAQWRAKARNTVHQPPEHLSEEARRLWARVVASKPADWFEEGNLPILAQYCDLVAEQAHLVLRRNELNVLNPDSPDGSAFCPHHAPISTGGSARYGQPASRVLTDATGERRNPAFRQRFRGLWACRPDPNGESGLKPVDTMERTALLQARSAVNKTIRDYALASATLAVKLRLTVQNTVDRKSGVLSEKVPEAVVAAAARSSLLAGRQLDS